MSSREDSIITDIFRGQLFWKVTCKICKNSYLSFESFLSLSLPFPRSSTRLTHSTNLYNCIEEFTKGEEISEEEGYKCEHCKKSVACKKEACIWRFPEVLILHLKRFYYSTWRKEKLDTIIEFPRSNFDLTFFRGESGHETAMKPVYELYGVINHSGSLDFGHYEA